MFSDYTIQNAEDDLTGMLHGGSLAKVKNLSDLWRRAARKVVGRIDPPETVRSQDLTLEVDTYDYTVNADVKKVKDLQPTATRNASDRFRGVDGETFDVERAQNTFYLSTVDGERTLRIAHTVVASEDWTLLYYSDLLFTKNDGITWEATPTDGNSTVNLAEDSYNIFLYEAGILASHQIGGEDARADIEMFREELEGTGQKPGLYDLFAEAHPSEAIDQHDTYYAVR